MVGARDEMSISAMRPVSSRKGTESSQLTSAVLARLIPTSAVRLHLFWAEFTWHRVARLPRVDALSEPEWRGESGRPYDCHRHSIYRPVNCSVALSEPAGFNLPASLWRKQLAYALLHEGVCPAMRQLDVPLYEVVSLPWNLQLDLPQPLYSPLRQSCKNRNRAVRKVSSAVGPKLEKCAVWPGCRLAHTARSAPSPQQRVVVLPEQGPVPSSSENPCSPSEGP